MTTKLRRTSVYTIRLDGIDVDALPGIITDLADTLPRVQDRGRASVSFRTTDDTAARLTTRDAIASLPRELDGWTLTTGLGIHRRTVPA